MSEFLSADYPNALMLEMQYFWDGPHNLWRLEDLPEPQDHDTQRYAILASLVESLALAFNYRKSLGLRRRLSSAANDQHECSPTWAVNAPPLDSMLV